MKAKNDTKTRYKNKFPYIRWELLPVQYSTSCENI